MNDQAASDDMPKIDEASPEVRSIDLVQRWMQAVITHPAGVKAGIGSDAARAEIPVAPEEIESVIGRSQALGSIERLGVYANAYYARLLECLRDVFPIVSGTMGDDIFDHFALAYLQKYPSQTYTLCELGARFPQYLEETRPSEPDEAAARDAGLSPDWPQFVVELARLEWTIGEVFDGPGMEKRTGLTAADLAGIAPERWLDAKLTLAPCLRLLRFEFPVNDYFAKMRELERDTDDDSGSEAEEVLIPDREPTYLALSRRDYIVRRYPLSRPQYELLSALSRGETIGEALAAAAAVCELSDEAFAESLRSWFAQWAEDQFFLGVSAD